MISSRWCWPTTGSSRYRSGSASSSACECSISDITRYRLPEAIGELEALTDFLYLHDNRLRELPASLAKLKKLRYLNVSDNELGVLPDAVFAMPALVELRASKCGLATVPEALGRLTNLRELHLRDNALTTLPSSIGELKELRHLDLRGNPLATLPAALGDLPKLDKLDLRWTPSLDAAALPWIAKLEAETGSPRGGRSFVMKSS